jgi:transposase InsO family protein
MVTPDFLQLDNGLCFRGGNRYPRSFGIVLKLCLLLGIEVVFIIAYENLGVQYASHEYVKELKFYNFQISMSRKANPYENAHAESFIKTLKSEEVYLWEYRTMEDVLERIPSFIEDVYNRKRLHSSLGYRPPCEFEAMVMVTRNPCQSDLISPL